MTRAERCGQYHKAITGNRRKMRDELRAQKKELGHGRFLKWIRENRKTLGFGEDQAQIYMKSKTDTRRYLDKHSKERKAVREAAKRVKQLEAEQVEVENFKKLLVADLQTDVRPLAREIVGSGFQQLSRKRHPDIGGSKEAMQELQEARDWLVSLIDSPFMSVIGLGAA